MVQLMSFVGFIAFFFIITDKGVPTKNLYSLRFDKPYKLGNYYIGIYGVIRNLIGIPLLIVAYNAKEFYRQLSPAYAQHRESLILSQEAVQQGNGFIASGLLNFVLIAVILFIVYKIYQHHEAGGFEQHYSANPKIPKNEIAARIQEREAKKELFRLMYENGDLELPLKPKVIDGETYSEEDKVWIPYHNEVSYKNRLKRWKDEH